MPYDRPVSIGETTDGTCSFDEYARYNLTGGEDSTLNGFYMDTQLPTGESTAASFVPSFVSLDPSLWNETNVIQWVTWCAKNLQLAVNPQLFQVRLAVNRCVLTVVVIGHQWGAAVRVYPPTVPRHCQGERTELTRFHGETEGVRTL